MFQQAYQIKMLKEVEFYVVELSIKFYRRHFEKKLVGLVRF